MGAQIFKLALVLLLLLAGLARSQSTYVAGVFPTIDHSGTITNKLEYSLYYFAAIPLVNIKNPEVSRDAFFNLFYSEQALSYNLTHKLSLTGSYVYQRANVVYDNFVNENRFYVQAKYKHFLREINLMHRIRFDGRFIHDRYTNQTPFTHRLRYLIGFDAPITERLYFTAYEEAFFNTFQNAGAVYGENWAMLPLAKK